MIIKYPTGLYASVLPKSPSEPGNVTFVISSTTPPRTNLLFPKLPPGVGSRRRDPTGLTTSQRRPYMDELVYSTARSNRIDPGTGMQQYEVGQVLGFDDRDGPPVAELLLAGIDSEMRHNIGLFDYNRLGLDQSQTGVVIAKSAEAYHLKRSQLAAAREEHIGLQVVINENQKVINETAKAIAALTAIGDDSLNDIVGGLVARKAALLRERGAAINRANELVRITNELNADVIALSQMVR